MIELFSSVVSYILSGLKIYLAEKQIKTRPTRRDGPFGRTVAGPL
jgi:hypothetical protein